MLLLYWLEQTWKGKIRWQSLPFLTDCCFGLQLQLAPQFRVTSLDDSGHDRSLEEKSFSLFQKSIEFLLHGHQYITSKVDPEIIGRVRVIYVCPVRVKMRERDKTWNSRWSKTAFLFDQEDDNWKSKMIFILFFNSYTHTMLWTSYEVLAVVVMAGSFTLNSPRLHKLLILSRADR